MNNVINTRVKLKTDTTENWESVRDFVPLKGELIIYSDYTSFVGVENGEPVVKYIPNFKIGNGNTYLQDLLFVDEDLRKQLNNHINNTDIHVTASEKAFWNNKLNVNDESEVTGETLLLNRD